MDGRWKEADARFRRAIELEPDNPLYRLAYSNFLIWMNRMPEAEAQARDSVRLPPHDPLVLNGLMFALEMSGRDEDAKVVGLSSLELDPDCMESRMLYPKRLVRWGHVESGMSMADKLVRDNPDNPDALYFSAQACLLASRPDRARDLWTRLVSLNSSYVSPMSLFLLASDLGFDDEALDLLERGVETRDARMIQLNRVRESSRFKDHPRFKAVVAKMGFP